MIHDVTVPGGASGRRRLGRLLIAVALALLCAAACRGDRNQPITAERPVEPAAAPATTTATTTAAPAPAAATAAPSAATAGAPLPTGCEKQPFVDDLPIAEASAAVVTELDGVATLMVIGDSGHDGDYLLVDPQSGAVRERGKLPLGGRGDDLEGLAVRGDRFWALTSSGWLRAWKRRGPPTPGFELVTGPVAIGAGQGANAMTCGLRRANCGRNFEGLCLAPRAGGKRPHPEEECVGMAASKADGRLYCIVEKDEALTVDPARWIAVSKPEALADCNIDGETLWAGANLFDFNRVWRVDGWRTPEVTASVQVRELGTLGTGFCEGMAVAGDTMFRLSDTQGSPSLVSKFRCSPPTK